jgi:ABC-type Fe3+/spermidine/putrescine transport system ATPase subunit
MSQIKNLTKVYSDSLDSHFELNIPELTLPDHGVTAIVGPSGAGKTTLIRHLIGLEACDEATWFMQGFDLFNKSCGQRGIGVVFQKNNLFGHLSALDNITLPLNRKASDQEESAALSLLKSFGIENKAQTKAKFLSGGEEQRVALARALFLKSNLLILDEPFSALDLEHRKQAHEIVLKISKEYKIPIFLITHDQEDLKALADNIVYMQKGRVVEVSNQLI